MKLIKFILTLMIVTTASTTAQARVKLENYQDSLATIKKYEEAGQLKAAALESAYSSLRIAQELGLDSVVVQSALILNEIRHEVITKNRTVRGGLSFFGLFSISGAAAIHATKIITMNPEEVNQFDSKEQAKLKQLKNDLTKYVQKNELAIVYTKALAAKALQLMVKMNESDRLQVEKVVDQATQKVRRFSFSSSLQVERCILTSYASYTDSANVSASALLGMIGFSLGEENTHYGYNEKQCSASERISNMSSDEILSARISSIDFIIDETEKALSLSRLVESHAPFYPTWGL